MQKEIIITVESKIYNPNEDILIQYGKLEQSISRILYNELIHNPKLVFKFAQKKYLAQYGILARVFKSIWIEVKRLIQANQSNHKNNIEHYEQKVKELEIKIKKSKNPYFLKNKLNKTKQKLNNLQNQEKVNSVWGSKAYHKKQYDMDHEVWLANWRRKRDHRIYIIGSHDEHYGNSLCQLQSLNQLRLTLSPNTVDKLNLSSKHLNLQVDFNKKKQNYEYLKIAIANKQPLTYTILQRENNHWYCQISFSIYANCEKKDKCIGIDINHDLIITCHVKADGNPEKFADYSFDSESLSSNQMNQELINIVHQVVNQAKKENKNIAVEDISLKDKKNKDHGTKTNRKLHMIPYLKFLNYLKSYALKNNILVIEVNPAYTSISARHKYMRMLGRSVHSCAALTIGRRGLGYKERIPSKFALLLQSGEKIKHRWTQWAIISKKLKSVPTRLESSVEDTKGSNEFWFLLTQSDGVGDKDKSTSKILSI